jgi:hypothetical protein
MARHKSPRVKEFWHLLVEMQGLIDSGLTPRAAAVRVAGSNNNKQWQVITKGKYESALQWLQDNYRKFRDELNPGFAIFEQVRAAREKWLSTLSPQERKRAEQRYAEELAVLDRMREQGLPAKVRAARRRAERATEREAARQYEVERARWQEWFKQDPKEAVEVLIDKLIDERKAELMAERKPYYYDDD